MGKIHTRTKRKKGLASSHGHKAFYSGATRKLGAKSFVTKEKALAWMKAEKMTEKEYVVVPAKKNKKFAVKKIL